MAKGGRYEHATRAAERFLDEEGIVNLPVDPFAIARDRGIVVQPMPASSKGVSGMLLRSGDTFGICYATHIRNEGFRRFSVGHELGHYLLPGHPDHVLPRDGMHESRAGFSSGNRFELEADHFSAGLLMPRPLFKKAADKQRECGLNAVLSLSELCVTSRTATAIQYAKCHPDQVAIILSTGRNIDYCFMSDSLKELRGLEWIKKATPLPKSATYEFNRDPSNIASGKKAEETTALQNWFGGHLDAEMLEEVIGLGSYGRTLTVLSTTEFVDQEEIDDDEEMEESWRPRFR